MVVAGTKVGVVKTRGRFKPRPTSNVSIKPGQVRSSGPE